MAGDHKCPVCQSTFTRPQHVARHMRSHTGDRPYKCQHCGDQFARSDLLSRHINKCHASEKPPTTTVPSRRKGTAAASRATTSKQACDQCVTSSLPCDGANPCSKCVQRKCRCTFVKFHRQTAPSGPGHPVPPTMPPAGHGRHSISLGAPRLPDDFLLAPPPGTMALSSMYAPHHYPMPHSSAVYPHDFTSLPPLSSALAPESSMSTMMQPHHRENIENSDTMARFRAQAELLSRAGVMPNGALTLAQSASAADTGVTLPGLYAASGSQESHYDNRYNLPQSDQWDGSRQFAQTKDFEAPYGPRSQSHTTVTTFSAAGAAGGEPSLQTHPPMTATSSSYEGGNPASYHHHPNLPAPPSMYQHHSSGQNQHQHSRSDDVNSEADFGSDAGSSGTGHSHSIPSSANSSTVHLPLPGFNNLRTRAELGGKEGSFQGQNPQEGEGGFSSAFGLMSLDDPNVLAGIANDGQPFFSGITFPPGSKQPANANANPQGGGMALATPTQQDLLAQLKSAGGRTVEMDSKEMHEFWKMYLRTPLTGATSSGANGMMFPLQTPTGPGAPLGQARPSSSRRHSRVASLPSMKTPPLFADGRLGQARPSTGDQEAHAQQQQQQQEQEQAQERAGGVPAVSHNSNSNANANSMVRTAAHDADDLRSYEQAVLARRAPMTLNLVPKRKGSLAVPPSVGARPPPNPAVAKSKSMSPVVPHAAFASGLPPGAMGVGVGGVGGGGGSKIADILNRPPSSSSASTGTAGSSGSGMSGPGQASSSLAHAFGGSEAGADGHLLLSQHGEYATAAGAAGSYRPSFKRIASQTLGPAHTKRALLGPAGWDRHHQEEEDDGEGRGARGGRGEEDDEDGDAEDVGMRGIHERGRRLAAQVHG